MEVISVIPARGGSKGIKNKNLKLLDGKPLIQYSIENCLSSNLINRVYVSTDDKNIEEKSLEIGAKIIKRPAEISGDKASSEAALLHALDYLNNFENYRPDYLVFVQCTSPLIKTIDIDNAIDNIITNKSDVCHIVTPFHGFLWESDTNQKFIGINHDLEERKRRQDLSPQYLETGAIYVMRVDGFLKTKNRFFGNITYTEVPIERSIEINEMYEFEIAEFLIRKSNGIK